MTALITAALAASPAAAAENGPLAFDEFSEARTVEGFRVDADGGDYHGITAGIPGDQGAPVFSPDGTRILWAGGEVITDAEGGDPQPIDLPDGNPRWSPDGTRVVTHGLSIVRVDGGGTTTIGQFGDGVPEWSPDGSRIVFSDNDGEITVINANGTGRTPLTDDPDHFKTEPSFSPDGSRLAWLEDRGESAELIVANTDGSGATPFAEATFGQPPQWSPDGTKILFAFAADGDQRLATIPAGGGARVPITPGGPGDFPLETARAGVWSPDGERIAYVRTLQVEAGTTRDIVIIGADGSAPKAVSESSVPTSPSWGAAADVAPVVFIPGILGSEIWCNPVSRRERLWPRLGVDEEKLLLAADGETNASTECPSAGVAEPNYTDPGHLLGPGDSGIAESLLGVDIYGSALLKLEDEVGAENLYAFPWDWRRDTASSLERLDDVIDRAIEETGAEKVQIVAHSYGGLLALHYARDAAHRAKLERVTSVGSPYLGSPKSAFPLLTGTELPFESGLAVAFGGQEDLRRAATTMRGLFNLWPSAAFGPFLTVGSELGDDGVAAQIAASGGVPGIWRAAQARHVSTYDSFSIGALPWRMIVSGGVPTIRRVELIPEAGDEPLRAKIGLAPGDGTVPLRSQTLTASDGGSIPGAHADLATAELCASEHGGQMSDPALYPLIGPWLRTGGEPSGSAACRAERRVVFDTVDAEFAPAPSLNALRAGPMTVADAEAAGLVDVLRFGRQALVLADPAEPIQLAMAPQAGRTLRVTVLDVNGDASTVTVPETRSDGTLTVAVAVGAGSVVTPQPPTTGGGTTPPPPPAGPGPPIAVDKTGPKVTVKVKRVGRRFRVTVRAKDPAGVRRITLRLGAKGKLKRYKQPLKLSRRDVKRLRIRAEDKLGNRSKLVRAKLPKR